MSSLCSLCCLLSEAKIDYSGQKTLYYWGSGTQCCHGNKKCQVYFVEHLSSRNQTCLIQIGLDIIILDQNLVEFKMSSLS